MLLLLLLIKILHSIVSYIIVYYKNPYIIKQNVQLQHIYQYNMPEITKSNKQTKYFRSSSSSLNHLINNYSTLNRIESSTYIIIIIYNTSNFKISFNISFSLLLTIFLQINHIQILILRLICDKWL